MATFALAEKNISNAVLLMVIPSTPTKVATIEIVGWIIG